MDPLSTVFRITVLTVPDIVAPEQFPAWLRREALEIQESCDSNSFAILSLFLPSRIRAEHSAKKLDALMQSITDRHRSIYRVDLVIVDEALNTEEIELIQSDAEQDFARLLESVARLQAQKEEKSRLH